jgi:hypothetical protein
MTAIIEKPSEMQQNGGACVSTIEMCWGVIIGATSPARSNLTMSRQPSHPSHISPSPSSLALAEGDARQPQ